MPKIETRPTSSSRFESGFESTTIPALSVSWPRLGDFTGLLLRCVFPVAYGGGDPHPSYCLLRPPARPSPTFVRCASPPRPRFYAHYPTSARRLRESRIQPRNHGLHFPDEQSTADSPVCAAMLFQQHLATSSAQGGRQRSSRKHKTSFKRPVFCSPHLA